MDELSINQRVFVKNEPGTIRFIGQTQFASGTWIGVELQQSHGKNNGSVNDIRYFECEKKDGNYGVFVRKSLISSNSLEKSKSMDTSNLENIINKLQDKLRHANEETKELKRKIEQLKEEVTQHQNATQSIESKLEMVTTDKEFLEESNHKVNLALDELQRKYEDLSTDFQIMSEEVELNKQIEQEIIASMDHSNANEVDIQVILSRNKSLEIALTSLQKLSAENELNLKKEISDLNQRLALRKKEIGSHDQLLRNISVAQETIDSLQSQLDSALQSEKMIEHLNIENDSLNSKVSSLTKTVDELTELHELDKSLEENQALVEKELRKDIYNLSSKIKNNETVIQDLSRKNKYMESKISEFKNRSNNSNMGDNEKLEELQMQLEALKLESRKTQASNESYRITHDLISSKLEILEENMHLPNGTYKVVLKILLSIKIIVSSISVINNIITIAVENDATYKKSILFTVTNHFYILQSFLQNVSALWEFNYGHETYKSVEVKFYKMVSDLQLEIDNSTTYLKEGDYEGINIDYIHDFLLQTTELMDLKFLREEETSIPFQNAFCSKFLLESFRNESSICGRIVNILKFFLDTSHGVEEESIPSTEQLDGIYAIISRQETEFHQLIHKLHDAFGHGKSINISMSSMPNFSSSLAELNSPIDLLSNVLAQFEVEDRLNKRSVFIDASLVKNILEDNEVGSGPIFTSLLEILKRRDHFIGLQVIDNHHKLPGIYSLLDDNHFALDVNTTKNDADEELKSMKLKYAGISTKLFEKEKVIQELQLNIKFLQNSMESTSVKNKEHIKNLKTELDQIKDKNEEFNQKYQALLEANQKLELEMEELLESSSFTEGGNVFKKFANLEIENQYNTNMALLDEIMVLRKILKSNLISQGKIKEPGLDWLEQPLVTKLKMKSSLEAALEFERNSSHLRDISKNAKLVNISNNSTLWRPKASMPKYMALMLEERATNYFEQRSTTLSELSSLSSLI